jgi:hypothetical protein
MSVTFRLHFFGAYKIMLSNLRLVAIAALLLGTSLPAMATLGGDASTATIDQAKMKAAVRVTTGDRYAVHELTLPNGIVAREYVSPQGQVFAVTWQGPVKPDLRQLLGSYFERYAQAPSRLHGSHTGSSLLEPDLVVQSMGHLRAFSGRAYLPNILPGNVVESELQ